MRNTLLLALCAAAALVSAWNPVARAVTIDDVVSSFEGVVDAVRTWEGSVRIQRRSANDAHLKPYAEGVFSWDAAGRRHHARLQYHTRFGHTKSGQGLDEAEWRDGTLDREVLINDDVVVGVWHDLPEYRIDGLSIPPHLIPDEGAIIASRRRMEPSFTSFHPDTHLTFCPEYMFRGDTPSLLGLLKAIRDRQGAFADPNIEIVETVDTFTVEFPPSYPASLQLLLVNGRWVPRRLEVRSGSFEWQWQNIEDVLLPTRLEIRMSSNTYPHQVYILSNNRVNRAIAGTRFELESMAMKDGTILADFIRNAVFVIEKDQVIEASQLTHPPSARGRSLWIAGIVLFISLLGLALEVMRRRLYGPRRDNTISPRP